MRRILTSIVLVLSAVWLYAGPAHQQVWDQAIKHYQEQDYSSSLSLFESLEETGHVGFNLYYNMGNCHYRLGQYTQAIWMYERAAKYQPTHPDLMVNMALTRQHFVDEFEALPQLPLIRWYSSFMAQTPPNLFVLLAFAWVLGFVCIIGGHWFQKLSWLSWRPLWLGLMLIGALGALGAKLQENYFDRSNEAIIFASTAKAYSEPSESALELFVLHEGLKVECINQQGNWQQVGLPNGDKAWMKKEALKLIP